jgi:NADPH:quinone reductase-like Zn-dependent oxidoreductase
VGLEGAGVIEQAGKASGFKVGQRIHFVLKTSPGSWAEYVVFDALAVKPVLIPDGLR